MRKAGQMTFGKTHPRLWCLPNIEHRVTFVNKNSRFCLLVGDSHSIKKAKEVINDLLNLDPPASNATSASAQAKNAPKLKPKPKPQLVKKLPPMPTEPKPVGQVSRFSLLIPGGCDSNQDDLSDGATVNDSGNSDCDEPIQKDDWLPRETKNSKKKKKERKRSEKNLSKSDNSEKQQQLPTKSMKTEKVCQKETSKQPTSNTTPKLQTQPHNSESNSTTQTNSKKSKKSNSIPPKIIPPAHNSLSAEEDVKTPTGSSSLDQDFLKTSQNLDLEEFRKSLEQINNNGFENGISSNFLRNGSISSLGQSDDSICDSLKTSTLDGVTDLSLYSIQGTISNLQGKLIQGLKGIESKEYCFKIFTIT